MTEKTLGQIAEEAREQFTEKATMSQYSREADLLACMWDFIAQAVIEAHEARKWQPIESAPKDADTLLLYRVRGNVHWVGYWCTDFKGWRLVGSNITVDATHWQPLPAPPKQGD